MKIQFYINIEYQKEAVPKLKEQYESDDFMGIVFRDNGFKDAEVKTNAIQILKQSGVDDVKNV